MNIHKMEWKKRYTDSGFVKEVTGKDKNNPDKLTFSDFIEPDEGQKKAGKAGWATFTLENNKCYIIKDTKTKEMDFVIVNDGKKRTVKKYEVNRFLDKQNSNSAIKQDDEINHKNVKPFDETKSNNDVIHLSYTLLIETMVDKVDMSYKVVESKSKEIGGGILYGVKEYSKSLGLDNEFTQIQEAFAKGNSKEEVKELLLKDKSSQGDELLYEIDKFVNAS